MFGKLILTENKTDEEIIDRHIRIASLCVAGAN
jgi:hypothetical protein